MVTAIGLTLAAAALLFVIGEVIRRKLNGRNEISRKLVHVLHGLTVISWVFVANKTFIIGFEVVFFLAMFIVRYAVRHWSRMAWLHQVGRVSWGEFFFPLGIITSLALAQSKWFFVAAVAQLTIADAAAALIGQRWGKHTQYTVFNNTKSVVGTAAFIVVAVFVMMAALSPDGNFLAFHAAGAIIAVPLILAAVENVSGKGSDNLTLPLICVLLLNYVV